jgi:hypothetical protein
VNEYLGRLKAKNQGKSELTKLTKLPKAPSVSFVSDQGNPFLGNNCSHELKKNDEKRLPTELTKLTKAHDAKLELLQRSAAIRPAGYSDAAWLAALADAERLGYPPKQRP